MRPVSWLVTFEIYCEGGVWRRDARPYRKRVQCLLGIYDRKRDPTMYRNVRGPFPLVLAETKAKPKPTPAGDRLRVKFALTGRTLAAQVLEMPQRLRGFEELWCEPGYAILSYCYPAIHKTEVSLYLRGSHRDRDRERVKAVFPSEAIAAKALAAFRRGVSAINRRLAKGEL